MFLKKLYKLRLSIIFLIFITIPNLVLAQTVSGNTDGVSALNGKQAVVNSVNEIAGLIYTFAFAIFVMVCIVGTIIGIWSTIKHIKGQNIDVAEIIIVWCQIFFIIFICYSSSQIANYIASNGYSIDMIISQIT